MDTTEKRTPYLGRRGLRDGSVTLDKLSEEVKEALSGRPSRPGGSRTGLLLFRLTAGHKWKGDILNWLGMGVGRWL